MQLPDKIRRIQPSKLPPSAKQYLVANMVCETARVAWIIMIKPSRTSGIITNCISRFQLHDRSTVFYPLSTFEMFPLRLSALLLAPSLTAASSILLSGGTIIAFNHKTEALEVIRDGSLLITDDRITSILTDSNSTRIPEGTETVHVTGKIITPGFIDTYKHGWRAAFKTLGSNTSLIEYFN